VGEKVEDNRLGTAIIGTIDLVIKSPVVGILERAFNQSRVANEYSCALACNEILEMLMNFCSNSIYLIIKLFLVSFDILDHLQTSVQPRHKMESFYYCYQASNNLKLNHTP